MCSPILALIFSVLSVLSVVQKWMASQKAEA